MHRLQTHPAQMHALQGKPDASKTCTSNSVKDNAPYIQAVTLHPHQLDGSQKKSRCREEMLRKNYDQIAEVTSHELSSALRSAGAQNQMQSQVMETSKCNEAGGPVNGQQPQPMQPAPSPDNGAKRDTPPPGNYRSLTRRVGEALKWRDRSQTIGRHAQWAGQYNGVRYLLQYVHWQTVRPKLTPISEWEERMMNERLAQLARSAEHETLDHRVVGSSLHEKLQKLQMITGLSSNNSSVSLEYHDWSVIRHTLTPCSPAPNQKEALSSKMPQSAWTTVNVAIVLSIDTAKPPMHSQRLWESPSRISMSIRPRDVLFPHHGKACEHRSITMLKG